ncbi:MAG: KamA family radical SAM protein [Sphaerochaetaceae bacterium]|nr:KamA family radical SAM protein [Sphaerochaetaceae bacterium]NLO60757.1 KamA family radical SAM protein [Spirochaetales bacterium]MDD2405889.1 KamA family radical SAM protein [Sphaerochaetaceae bacterium]MDD4258257.1 KamA family radical SAM protein [Sphaerochaetaceae bacterium]MDD4841929.1 KamA family radical SAM protein [Sphaerochaetaceae bacterium]
MEYTIIKEAVVHEDDDPPLKQNDVLSSTSHITGNVVCSIAATAGKTKVFTSKSNMFRKRFFPDATIVQWNDWHWQLAHRITTLEQLTRFLKPTLEERQALEDCEGKFPFSITPYYLSLVDLANPMDPLRKTIVPTIGEAVVSYGEKPDPLDEDRTSPVPGIVHRYPDRVLFLTTSFCSVYCRYCTRSRMVGGHTEALEFHWHRAIDYIRKTETIRDVVISGGDPLTLADDKIEWLLKQLSDIPHVEMIRIGTKVPMVLPQRITTELVNRIKKYKPLYLSVHCTHPNEITAESKRAFDRLADSGIIMGSQTVLLRGVNDDPAVMTALMHRLLQVRVRPYYLFQCDPIVGSAHFRTSVDTGKEIIRSMRGFTSGYAIPQYVIDTPGGGGKVPILPEYEVGKDADNLYLRNYEDKVFAYPDQAVKEAIV